MNLLKKEWNLILLVLIPVVYLMYLFDMLPDTVPIHWDIYGQVDGYGSKGILWIPAWIPVVAYLLFSFIPKMQSNRGLNQMGNKYHKIKWTIVSFLSLTMMYLFYLIGNEKDFSTDLLFVAMGVFFIFMGNYFQTIKTNYLIGIRTPWTLKNESVWKRTHVLAGQLWFIGGIIIILNSLFGVVSLRSHVFFLIAMMIVFIPIVHSYLLFHKLKNSEDL